MTRLFYETPEQQERLQKLDSSYATSIVFKGEQRNCCVALVDNVSKQEFHRGLHPESFSKALDIALSTVSARPRTIAEIAADAVSISEENARLRELVEQLKARESEPAPAQEDAPTSASPPRRRQGA